MARRGSKDADKALRNLYRDDPKDKRFNRQTDGEKRRDAAAAALSRMIEKARRGNEPGE